MRTLTKERVNHSGLFNNSGALSMDLIGDGPNEIVLKRTLTLRDQTEIVTKQEKAVRQEQKLKEKIRGPKELLVDLFMKQYPKTFGITKEQFDELIARSMPKEEVEAMEVMLANSRKLKWWSGVHRYSVNTLTTTILAATFNSIFHLGPIWVTELPLWIFVGSFCVSGPMFGMFYIFGLLESFNFMFEKNSDYFCSSRYLRCRKYLKKLYPDNYFPHDILQEKLKLLEAKNQEINPP